MQNVSDPSAAHSKYQGNPLTAQRVTGYKLGQRTFISGRSIISTP